ncbi:CRISPR-associated helicase/endonuclease Cas3 [Streptomyces sp. 1331.2]|uniref:CRISPR-associated helicase/endonuclease Cas3 n=1 Tax=Streptomyces sp. 1331.2 TaxID=1938835 RepID=UPI000BC4EEBC|nr:CRISPR-associated helicase/endonuclease Cas3 [Streptomyces sp. 1331.2]SOB88482.1 CRISPR-associated helicase, Cas3 family [Streptomyces sp. 1331.2]
MWGKSAGLPGPYPVICHLLDTAAVAGAVWDAVLGERVRARIAGVVGGTEGEAREVVMLWAGLHDVGKVSMHFQQQVAEEFAKLVGEPAYAEDNPAARRSGYLRHETATHWGLVEFFKQCGYPLRRPPRSSPAHQIAQLLGGHHGCFAPVLQVQHINDPTGYQPGLGTAAGWREQRLAHAHAVRRTVGAGRALESVLPGELAVVVAGLVVVADWLASQVDVIEPRMPGEDWKSGDAELAEHFRVAAEAAPGWVREAGLGRASFPDREFSRQFPFAPNKLQADVAAHLPGVLEGPGLLLVTAPTGDGKTETALHAASLMARASGASGVYFALPTMATADAMFTRVRAFAERNVEGDRALTLLHSMAWLSPDYAPGEGATDGTAVLADTEAGRWLRTGRRGLLAPLANGTIDQALTGVLPVRYGFLRLFGLSNKVLVVDEAHSYGPWMHSLLVRMLEWLGAFGAPVVLLSATLTGKAASSLVDAYRRGAGFLEPTAVEPCYPGWLFVDAAGGAVSEPREVGSSRARTLRVETRQVHWDVRGQEAAEKPVGKQVGKPVGKQGRREALHEILAPVTTEGGCVLVCCTTVDEAQRTYRYLESLLPELAAREGGLRLLHSRFPAHERQRITTECETAYGKPVDDTAAATPRAGSILVATQIVEQSLDLDFDLIVSDLAPLAQLLQRAGRGKRHERPNRPAWTGRVTEPHMIVLEPLDDKGRVAAPRSWGTVYDASLLRRTSLLLGKQSRGAIEVPGDVQRLVDEVYADDFGADLAKAAAEELDRLDAERIASDVAEGQLAKITGIDPPYDVLDDLSPISGRGFAVPDDLLTTRLGADSGRAVCVFEREDGWSLAPDRALPLPKAAALSREDIALIMRHTVPLPGRWLAGRTDENAVPKTWNDRPLLADLALLCMRRDGDQWTGRLGERQLMYSKVGISEN